MRLREPAAWVAFGALALNLVLAVVGMVAYSGPLANVALTLSGTGLKSLPWTNSTPENIYVVVERPKCSRGTATRIGWWSSNSPT